MIKKQVMKFTKTTMLRMIATRSASLLSSDAFSPRDIAHNFHRYFSLLSPIYAAHTSDQSPSKAPRA